MTPTHFIAAIQLGRGTLSAPPDRLRSHVRKLWTDSTEHCLPSCWALGCTETELSLNIERPGTAGKPCWAAGWADLHNRDELDQRLGKLGARPCSGDLERIVSGFLIEGERWLLQLRGPFALAVREQDDRIVLIRDQIGLCPLYYLATAQAIHFSSDLRALTELDVFDGTLDAVGLAHAVSGLWGDPGATAWRQIRRLPGGHRLQASSHGVRLEDYWQPARRIRYQSGNTFSDYARKTRALLHQAVKRNLGPGRTALELSGGFDSSTVAGFVAKNLADGEPRPLALTFDFEDSRYTDVPYARSVARMHDLDWRPVAVGASQSGAAERAERWKDLPGNYLWDEGERMSAMAKEAEAVRYLTGQFGDAVFVGMGWATLARYLRAFNVHYVLKHSHWGRRLPANLLDLLRRHPWSTAAADQLRPPTRCSFLHPDLRAKSQFDRRPRRPNPFDPDAGLQVRASNIRMPQFQRVIELHHRLAVEAQLAVGHPLADVDLVEFALSVPPEYLVGQPANRSLHAAAAAPALPREVAQRSGKADLTWTALDAVESQNPDRLIERSVLADYGWIDRGLAGDLLTRVREKERRRQPIGWDLWELIGLVETEVFLQSLQQE